MDVSPKFEVAMRALLAPVVHTLYLHPSALGGFRRYDDLSREYRVKASPLTRYRTARPLCVS